MSFLDCCFSSLSARSPKFWWMACEERAGERPYLATQPWPILNLLRNNTNQQHGNGKNHKALYRQIFNLPAFPWVPAFSSSSGPSSMGDKQENKRTPLSLCTTALGATGRDPTHHLPYLQPSLAPAIPTASLQIPPPPPQSWTLTCASSRFMEQLAGHCLFLVFQAIH